MKYVTIFFCLFSIELLFNDIYANSKKTQGVIFTVHANQ